LKRLTARLRALVLAVATVFGPLPPATAQTPGFDLIARRGGARALEMSISTIEFDIGITKEREPVVWHDETMGA